jgi:alpha-L-fucosidase 2
VVGLHAVFHGLLAIGAAKSSPERAFWERMTAFRARPEKASIGWQYDGQCAALVGLTDDAKTILLGKIRNSNPRFRFPAMWGPNYDWLPDQDHGSNIMYSLQKMVMSSSGDQVYLLPAWPKDWNVRFKLHAPKNTTVQGMYRNGKFEQLVATPESRRKDVHIMEEAK